MRAEILSIWQLSYALGQPWPGYVTPSCHLIQSGVSCNTQRHPPVCAGVRYIWSPAHTGGWRGCCGVSGDTPEHVTRHVMWHSFGPPWLQTSRSQCWTTTGKKQNMEVESASNVNCDPSSKSPLKLYFWSKEGVMH